MLVRAIEGYSTFKGILDVACSPYWLLTTGYCLLRLY
jgi:hypothetical protein